MRHVTSLEDARVPRPSVVTIGVFDGVHRGHQYLINQLIDHSAAANYLSVVLTFFPSPDLVIHGSKPGYYLTLPDRKAQLLGNMGVDLVVTHPFDDQVRRIRAGEFVDNLLTHLSMASLWVGEDFVLGYKREGNVEFLRRAAADRGFELRIIDLMDAGGERVSSSRVREVLLAGDVGEAARLLGRAHRVPGSVIHGAGRGRTIGIPTANLLVPPEQALPARGVYAAWAWINDLQVQAVVNIGLRPTFDGSGALTVEAHLLDFRADLYDQSIALDFVARLRDERRFEGVEALITQIQRDIVLARTALQAEQRLPH